jgi:phosphate transport system substrate-binding protein
MKLARAIAAAAIPALLMAGCGGGGNATPAVNSINSPVANASRTASAIQYDTSANDLHAGGATFPAAAYNGASQPVGSYFDTQALPTSNSLFATNNYKGSANVYYCLTGSGFGKSTYDGASTTQATSPCAPLGASPTGFGGRVDPPDFAGSDQALLTTDYATYLSVREGGVNGSGKGEPFEMPSVAGPIVFPFNPSNFTLTTNPTTGKLNPIRLSRWTYCAIANGTVTDWNDAAITKDNKGVSVVGGVSTPITFVYRTDGSGTSYLFQNHLNTVCGSTWPAPYNKAPYQTSTRNALWGRGTGKNWLGPTTGNFIGENGNPGVIAEIQATNNATGYAEGAYVPLATSPSLMQSTLLNNSNAWIAPTNTTAVNAAVASMTPTMGGAPDGTLSTTRPDCIFYIDPGTFANPTASNAYPIVGVSYLLAYPFGNGTHFSNVKKLLNYVASNAAGLLLAKQEYQAVPSAIRTNIQSAIQGTNAYAGKACISN